MRANGLQNENAHLRHQLSLIQRSRAWRLTGPLRGVRAMMLGKTPSGKPLKQVPVKLMELWDKGGIGAVTSGVTRELFGSRPRRKAGRPAASPNAKGRNGAPTKLVPDPVEAVRRVKPGLEAYDDVIADNAVHLSPRILIIAELSLRQCAKYRVWQKQDLLQRLGWRTQVVDWRDINIAMSALQVCTHVIFYRVPGFDDVMKLVKEAHRLKLAPLWEVDDLIFDEQQYRQNGNLDGSLSRAEVAVVMSGVTLFRKCMLACGRGIASTRALGQAMLDAGLSDVRVIENALDAETLKIADALRPRTAPLPGERIWVSYGSGTNTHDEDFRQAQPGLIAAMHQEPRLCLRVIGQLKLSDQFDQFGDRVERLTELSYADYLGALAQTDIAIAPLEATLFNDCKSNIKFLEASIAKVASVCSPRDAFLAIMKHGENGLLASTDDEWRDCFLTLARDDALRGRLAERASQDVVARYSPDSIAQSQGQALFGLPVTPERRGFRVMMANTYFSPRSFGGATIVAEEMADRLLERGCEVGVMTSRPYLRDRLNGNIRYATNGLNVLAAIIPDGSDAVAPLDNPQMATEFAAWLEAFDPDIVHIHAAQGLGTAMLRLCQERGIPYVITLHDAWWLCDRQFMVREDGRYCFQTRIERSVCQMCLPNARHLEDREIIMRQALSEAALLISPSEAHRQLYLANGVEPDRIVVNRNGFRWPERPRRQRVPGSPLRFGFVGGTEAVKGYQILKTAMESVQRSDWELLLVDNKINLGFSSIFSEDWSVKGQLKIVPAFTQDTLDDFYEQIDVLLFPSQWKESYGLSVREALSRDVWVVTTSPGGQSEDVIDGVNGTHIPIDGRSATIAAAVEALLAQRGKFDGYVNPLKHQLVAYDDQADELLGYLQQAVQPA